MPQQVALKLEETRKYYDFYNTLDSTREILTKQVSGLGKGTAHFRDVHVPELCGNDSPSSGKAAELYFGKLRDRASIQECAW
jgi:hypothetical protein